MHIHFDWDPVKGASNAVKHGVAFEDAMAVFSDPLARSFLAPDQGAGEERWITLGETPDGILLVVVHTWIEIDASEPRPHHLGPAADPK